MKSTIRIECIRNRKHAYIHVKVEHPDFTVIPSQMFNGLELPQTSVDYQIDEWFTEQDKRPIMDKYDIECIIDWSVYHRKSRRKSNTLSESESFKRFIIKVFRQYPTLERPIRAVLSEMHTEIFDKGLSNEAKLSILLKSIVCTVKGADGAYQHMLDIMEKEDIAEDAIPTLESAPYIDDGAYGHIDAIGNIDNI